MQTDTEFIRGLNGFTAMLGKHIGPVTPDNHSTYLQQQNKYVAYLQQFGLINSGHLHRFVLSTLKTLLDRGCGTTAEVREQLWNFYGLRLPQLMQMRFETDGDLPSAVLPVDVVNRKVTSMACILEGQHELWDQRAAGSYDR